MATTLAYIASLCTRKYTSSANAKNDVACQEFYDSSYNYVGIISFPGLNLANKVITEIWLDIDAEKAGYGVKNTKTVYLRKANCQDDIASGVTGGQYVGDELGTFEGAFYGNYNGYHITGPLFDAMAAYISAGNNSFTIYNPSATASLHGYSYNYMQWASVVITITFEDVISLPTVSSSSASLGSALTIFTNRSNNAATHTLSYRFGNAIPGKRNSKRYQRRLHDHLQQLCQWENDGKPNMHANADSPIDRCAIHFVCHPAGYQRDCSCQNRSFCEIPEHSVSGHYGGGNLRQQHFFLPHYAGWRYLYGCVLYGQQEAIRRWGYDANGLCDR